jgi:hypothetical protein
LHLGDRAVIIVAMLTTDEARYRERKAIVEAENWEGPDFKTCANAAAIDRALETSRFL